MPSRLKRYLRITLFGVIGLSLIPAYLRAYSLSGASEIPTVLLRDTFIVNKAAYDFRLPYSSVKVFKTGRPKRGDMVWALLPLPKGDTVVIKRAMGLPGETIEVRENRIFINGEALPVKILNRADFAWVPLARPSEALFENEDGHWIMYTPGRSLYRNHAAVRLAAGQYFLLGDNRDDSYDSRAFGPVSEDRIVGKMIYVFRTGPRW